MEQFPRFASIKMELNSGLGRLILSRPERGNALSPIMVQELSQGLAALISAGALGVAFMGEGRHFCTGFDLSDVDECSDGDLLLRFIEIEEFLQSVYEAKLTTIAVGKGRVVGAGADLFAACDRRIAIEGSTFSFPGAGFGLVLGTARLQSRVGRDNARRIVTLGEVLSAEDAQSIRLTTDVEKEESVEGIVTGIVDRLQLLGGTTLAAVNCATSSSNKDTQLASLVRSAALPGLRDRILSYKARVTAKQKT
ncbi:enoyl-CoA hydratase/isomerase family protein [Bradyrhizobium sp. JYMT SZCCT0428]|uniref:enoyl-CoA hydratase/isomerase family protein n=1 Tax=Bradyrhizobium sp. JYMT SZCCT0428 TaxID=2807673 RepID=UPI001BA500A7|nr:enoyl-CoA hydratase/isomerase family protein [Bradyrhizobium sp. JYMT SZCCT0428]MBR1149422.1 enoyl-CoA hydratase/isomerase family protein [Bradyrhizobium sp. JYMT SZCCT0428]